MMSFRQLLWNLKRNIRLPFLCESSLKRQSLFHICHRHSGERTDTLRPLRVTSVARRTKPQTQTARNNKRMDPSLRVRPAQKHPFEEEGDDDDPTDSLANTIGKYSSKFACRQAEEEQTRQLFRDMKFIRARTIGNKFFRKPPTPNLLSWSAKEQIQYLHERDPEEWSTQKLSELFPVSESSIKKIIKSKVRMNNDADIIKHDQSVQRYWADLKASLVKEDTTTDDVYKAFINSYNEITVENAAGIPDLPFPVKKKDRFNPRGTFSLIVRDCYDAKKEAIMKIEEEKRKTCEQFSAVLSEISKIFKVKSEGKTVKSRFIKPTDMGKDQVGTAEQLTATKNTAKPYSLSLQEKYEDKMGQFISQKYKDNTSISHSNESRNLKHNIQCKIKVQQQKQGKTNSDTYISGDCVYDKNGEFLYRIL